MRRPGRRRHGRGSLRDGQLIEVAQSGVFRGSVEIEDADIAGTFEGELSVRHKLRVRSTGNVTGTIRYGEIEVQAGGQLVGQIQVMSRTAAQAYKEAARQAMDEGVDGAPVSWKARSSRQIMTRPSANSLARPLFKRGSRER